MPLKMIFNGISLYKHMNYDSLRGLTAKFYAMANNEPWTISKSKIHGDGVHAREFIAKNTKIGDAISVGAEFITHMGSQLNHQFNPNARLVENNKGGCDLISIKDIRLGEEITVNYKDTPWYIDKNTKGFIEL